MIHPTFDPSTRRWYSDDGRDAPSIRELLRQYPPGTKCVDYFPSGRDVTPDERGYNINELRDTADRMRPKINEGMSHRYRAPTSPPVRSCSSRGPAQKYDYAAVMRMWADNESGTVIEQTLGMKRGSVTSIVQAERIRGNPLAIRRRPGRKTNAVV